MVLYTGSGSVLRGMNVIIPVDGMASVGSLAEQIVGLAHDPCTADLVQSSR